MSNTNNVDNIYGDFLKAADKFSEDKLKLEDVSKNMDNLKKSIPIPDSNHNGNNVLSDEAIDKDIAMQSYDPVTGETRIVESGNVKEILDRQYHNFTSDDELADIKNDIKNKDNNISDEDAMKIASLVVKRINGETAGFYDGLPDSMKATVNQIMMSSNTNNIKASHKMTKNHVARMLIDEFVKETKSSTDLAMDLDTLLAGFDKDVEKFTQEMSTDLANVMINIDADRKENIDAAIKKATEDGNEKAVERLTTIKNNIDESFNLNGFKEFCKTCKIKNFETKKTSRVFGPFNDKYETHKYVINDIRSCPTILNRHLTNNTDIQNLIVCLAFCKYCENMSPDNIGEHTFMYYFIRNIITIDRMNPKGNLKVNEMLESHKEFYNTFINNLNECINNLIIRNPQFESDNKNS